eukprot:m.71348 g.71348  ORF g.71348 m.71348 type:complete len:317 (+) comp12939_c0_seq3:1591-2541(+)
MVLHVVLGEEMSNEMVALEHNLQRVVGNSTREVHAENQSRIKKAHSLLQHEEHSTDGGPESNGHTHSSTHHDKIALFNVLQQVAGRTVEKPVWKEGADEPAAALHSHWPQDCPQMDKGTLGPEGEPRRHSEDQADGFCKQGGEGKETLLTRSVECTNHLGHATTAGERHKEHDEESAEGKNNHHSKVQQKGIIVVALFNAIVEHLKFLLLNHINGLEDTAVHGGGEQANKKENGPAQKPTLLARCAVRRHQLAPHLWIIGDGIVCTLNAIGARDHPKGPALKWFADGRPYTSQRHLGLRSTQKKSTTARGTRTPLA